MTNVLVVHAHPDENSSTAAIRNEIINKFMKNHISCDLIDLNKENYNPDLSMAEIVG